MRVRGSEEVTEIQRPWNIQKIKHLYDLALKGSSVNSSLEIWRNLEQSERGITPDHISIEAAPHYQKTHCRLDFADTLVNYYSTNLLIDSEHDGSLNYCDFNFHDIFPRIANF